MGGIEQVIYQLASGGARHGVENTVLSLSDNADNNVIQMDGHQTFRAKTDFQIASTPFSISSLKMFAELANEADVIHYQYPWPFMDIVHFATRVNKPTVVSYQSDIIRQKNLLRLYRPLKQKFLSSVDRIVVSSPNYLETSDVLQKFHDKVSVIPIGLDKAAYPVPSVDRIVYWQTQFTGRFFLFVGVLRYYKGLHILLEAAKGVDYPIVIVGAGPIEAELKAQAVKLGLHNVHFLGQLSDDDKVALLTLCYGIVFPSHLRSEAFGISLLEGAMYGKPMISSEIGTGTTFINIADETGLVVPPSAPIALRQAMQYLWEHPEQALEMGKHAEERYWKHFTADQMVKSYACLYRELVK
jgi:glycosyltransferase involved in cell wall biosynthesis